MLKLIIGPLTWAFIIIVGGLMLTPEGIIPIVTNPGLRVVIAIILLVLGAIGIISLFVKSNR